MVNFKKQAFWWGRGDLNRGPLVTSPTAHPLFFLRIKIQTQTTFSLSKLGFLCSPDF
jgi:hypothetical protein